MYNFITNLAGTLVFHIHIMESNLVTDTSYDDLGFTWFSSFSAERYLEFGHNCILQHPSNSPCTNLPIIQWHIRVFLVIENIVI